MLINSTFLSGVKVGIEPGDTNFHNTKTAVARWSMYQARFVSQLLTRNIKSNGLKANHDYICDYFLFSVHLFPFSLYQYHRGQPHSHLTKVTFGCIPLLCCSLLFDYLALVLCLINFFLFKNYLLFLAPRLEGS